VSEHIAVLGLARSGVAAARLALARRLEVYASDSSDSIAARAAAEEIRWLGGDAQAGGHDLERLAACDEVVVSPGIPPDAPVVRYAQSRGMPVIAEVELAARYLRVPYVAITGTNGKTTVTSLCAHLLQTAGFDAPPCGNIGTPLSEIALRTEPPDLAVVEVSSFQLAGIRDFRPTIGVLTNLAPDHLDRYPDLAAYYADKARLFLNADDESRWVLNGEDRTVLDLARGARGKRYLFRVESTPEPGEEGGFLDGDGSLVVRLGGVEEHLIGVEDLQILGRHNVANALAAAIVARLSGAEAGPIGRGLRSFRPIEHRLEPVAERDGVLWINDSKSTNLASTAVALRGMRRPTVLLLGGRHKGEPYDLLLPDMDEVVRHVIAYGEAASRVESDLAGHLPVTLVEGGLDKVVDFARTIVDSGDAVLLSPACSSFDMFSNYEERGRRFTELVRGGKP
jgi:UDP-N-acetylmuramoylalanine--D-glutamate ligase